MKLPDIYRTAIVFSMTFQRAVFCFNITVYSDAVFITFHLRHIKDNYYLQFHFDAIEKDFLWIFSTRLFQERQTNSKMSFSAVICYLCTMMLSLPNVSDIFLWYGRDMRSKLVLSWIWYCFFNFKITHFRRIRIYCVRSRHINTGAGSRFFIGFLTI